MVDENYNNTILNDIVGHNEGEHVETYSKSYLEEHIRPLEEVERDAIEKAIALCSGNIPKAAVFLNVAPSTLYRKIKQWDKKACKTAGR